MVNEWVEAQVAGEENSERGGGEGGGAGAGAGAEAGGGGGGEEAVAIEEGGER